MSFEIYINKRGSYMHVKDGMFEVRSKNETTQQEEKTLFCKQGGLIRVQYSCFLGTIASNDLDVLQLQIEEVINVERDKVYIFPMNKAALKQTILLGQAFDKKLVTNEIKMLFI